MAADRRGYSVRQLAGRADRDEASVRRTFEVGRKPRRDTIDVLARAAGLSPKRLHAELDDLAPEECDEQVRFFLDWLRGDEFNSDGTAFTRSFDAAHEMIWSAYRSVSPDAQNAAARALIVWGGVGPNTAALQHFIDALGVPELKVLVRDDAAGDNALHMTARNLADSFGFDDSATRRLMAPIVRALRKRDPKRVSAMIEYAAYAPYRPIDLEGTK
jgi:hypothetical protein